MTVRKRSSFHRCFGLIYLEWIVSGVEERVFIQFVYMCTVLSLVQVCVFVSFKIQLMQMLIKMTEGEQI